MTTPTPPLSENLHIHDAEGVHTGDVCIPGHFRAWRRSDTPRGRGSAMSPSKFAESLGLTLDVTHDLTDEGKPTRYVVLSDGRDLTTLWGSLEVNAWLRGFKRGIEFTGHEAEV